MAAAAGRGTVLRPLPAGIRQATGAARLPPARVKIGESFEDEGHLRYYASPASAAARAGPKKEEKRRMKLVKGLERDLSALHSIGAGEGLEGEVKSQIVSEAAELLLAQLTKLRAEAKEAKRRRKQEKAMKKAAAKMKDRSDSSESSSSDSECETVVKMSSLRRESDPVGESPLQTEDVIKEAMQGLSVDDEPLCITSTGMVAVMPAVEEGRIEVCMGGKCKRSGAPELMAEFEKTVGVEGAVVGCKCMGKCRDGPNVRVVNQSSVEDRLARAAKGPLCVGVGLDDVGAIVAQFLGERSEGGRLEFVAS